MKKFGRFLTAAFCLLMLVTVANAATLEEDILESCKTNKVVSIEQYGIREDALSDAFWGLYNAGKLPWNMERTYSYTYDQDTGLIKTFTPLYLDPAEYDFNLYEQKVAEIIDAAVCEGMSGWQTALSVHDYLVAHTAYDETYTYYRGYDLLVRGTAVCNGYAEAYMDIMTRLGFQCHMTVAEAMGDSGHAWNILELGGNWYHVDATWDDPVTNTQGNVLHKYFLKTDAEMLSEGQEGHHSWKTDLVCTDTTFSDSFWNTVDSRIIYVNADTCYLRESKDWTGYIQVRDGQSGEHTLLHTVEKEYVDVGQGSYAYEIKGLSLWDGRLYFSDADTVFSMLPDGTDLQVVHNHNLSKGSYIHGSHVADGILYLTLATHDYEKTEETYRLTTEPVHSHSYTGNTVGATCEEAGYVEYSCSCGISYRGEAVPARGHSYDGGTVVKEATRKEPGIRQFTCINCGHIREEEIPAKGGGFINPFRPETKETEYKEPVDFVTPEGEDAMETAAVLTAGIVILIILGILILGVLILLALAFFRRKKGFYEMLKEGKVPGQNK